MYSRIRFVITAIAVIVLIMFTGATTSTHVAVADGGVSPNYLVAQSYFQMINHERATRGLQPFTTMIYSQTIQNDMTAQCADPLNGFPQDGSVGSAVSSCAPTSGNGVNGLFNSPPHEWALTWPTTSTLYVGVACNQSTFTDGYGDRFGAWIPMVTQGAPSPPPFTGSVTNPNSGISCASVGGPPPTTAPPVTNPPVTSPPVTNPPVTAPPVTSPPVTAPPSGSGSGSAPVPGTNPGSGSTTSPVVSTYTTPTGATVQTQANGTIITTAKNGTVTVRTPNGTVTTTTKNGHRTVTHQPETKQHTATGVSDGYRPGGHQPATPAAHHRASGWIWLLIPLGMIVVAAGVLGAMMRIRHTKQAASDSQPEPEPGNTQNG